MRRSTVLILSPSISIPCSVGHSNSFSMEHHQQRKGREMFSQQTHRLSASFQSSPTFWSGNIGFKTDGQTKLWRRDLWSACHLFIWSLAWWPETNVIKLKSVIYARMLVPPKPLRPIEMFAGKTRAYLSEAPSSCSTLW